MRELLFEYLLKCEKIIIYGAGKQGRFLNWILKKNGISVSFFCDRNSALWNQKIEGTLCISPREIVSYRESVLILSPKENKNIKEDMDNNGFSKVLTWDDVKFLCEDNKNNKKDLKDYMEYVLTQNGLMKASLEKNIRFKGIHAGKRCFIIGNGPSIKDQNLSLLNKEITFTVNQISRAAFFESINTQYHLWADPNFFKTEFTCEGDYQLLELMKSLPKGTESFFPYSYAHKYIEKYDLDKYMNINFYEPNKLVGEYEDIDFTSCVRVGFSVVQYAIQLAAYMGFKEIYLLGCECTTILNVINARTKLYESETHGYEVDNIEKERAYQMYMSLPMTAYYESELNLLHEYSVIHRYCKKRGIKVINCTPGGVLDEFAREWFNKIVGS